MRKSGKIILTGLGAMAFIGFASALTGGGVIHSDNRPTTAASVDAIIQSAAPVMAALPDLTGIGRQDARDTAKANGFHNLREEDASGMGRELLLDSNWKVCSMAPVPGAMYDTQTVVTLFSVKTTEVCP